MIRKPIIFQQWFNFELISVPALINILNHNCLITRFTFLFDHSFNDYEISTLSPQKTLLVEGGGGQYTQHCCTETCFWADVHDKMLLTTLDKNNFFQIRLFTTFWILVALIPMGEKKVLCIYKVQKKEKTKFIRIKPSSSIKFIYFFHTLNSMSN